MADIRVNALPDLPSGIAAEDILHILDASTTANVDSKTTVDDVAEWIIDNKNITVSGIDAVPGLRDALDGKSNVGHTHTIQQIVGLTGALDDKLNTNQANISGRIINIKGVAITVPTDIGGVEDERIPDTVVIGDYLQFDTTDGGINNISGDTLKTNLSIDLVDNTADINKPISSATQTALDTKNSISNFNTGQAAQDVLISANTARATEIALNTLKNSYPTTDANKLAGIEAGADVTGVGNVWDALGISGTGSTSQVLTQRGVYVDNAFEVTKSDVDNAIGSGSAGTDYYSSNKTWLPIPTGGGGTVTKEVIDTAIGASPSGDSGKFYDEQGRFIDVVYDSVENAPITRNRTIETITIAGTRTNVQVQAAGTNEFSTITLLDSFNPVPTQYTTTFTSPNTTFTPALVLPAGSQGTSMSLTELDGTVHRFAYLVNGNYRLLAGGLTGTLRAGSTPVATTATVTANVTVPDQTDNQTITLVGDETGTFTVGDFISPQANNFGAYRGIFVDSITFDGTNTVVVGASNGATTFQTISTLRRSSAASTIQGTLPTWSYTPDTGGTVYSSAITNRQFTGSNTAEYISEIVTAVTGLETDIVQFGGTTATTLGGEAASSFTFDLGTETNIDSSFTITGGLNNMNTLVNTDGAPGVGLTVATTVTVIDPEATEVASQTFGVSDANDNNVDDVGNFINNAVNNNTETPIDFDSEYGSGVLTLEAIRAGNTNPWTILFNNNGATTANAGNLSTSSVQTGEIINETETLTVDNYIRVGEVRGISEATGIDTNNSINLSQPSVIHIDATASSGQVRTEMLGGSKSILHLADTYAVSNFEKTDIPFYIDDTIIALNRNASNRDFVVIGDTLGKAAIGYDSSTDTLITEAANVVGFGGGSTVTKAGVDTAIGAGTTGSDTLFYNQQGAWTTPAGAGIGDAVLANTQTFTGQNTFTDTAIFSSASDDGSIQVARRIVHSGNTGNRINFEGVSGSYDAMTFSLNGDSIINLVKIGAFNTINMGGGVIMNTDRNSLVQIFDSVDGDAFIYDSDTEIIDFKADTMRFDVDTFTGLPTVAGTTNQINVVNNANHLQTLSISSVITDRITANDNKLTTNKANVDTAIGTGGATTDYYASDKTWKTIPSGAGGTVTNVTGTSPINVTSGTTTPVVSLDTTVANTWSDTQTFSDSSTSGSIEIAGRMVHQGDSDTYVAFGTDIVQTVAGGVEMFRVTNNSSTQQIDVNPLSQNLDFAVNGTVGNARSIFYDSGADTTTINSQFTVATTGVFSNTSTTNGSLQVARRVTHQGDTDTFIDFTDNIIDIQAGGNSGIYLQDDLIQLNRGTNVIDFQARKGGSTDTWLAYSAGTDTISSTANNFVGIADQEEGSWTPAFDGNGTLGTVFGTYRKAGKIVVINGRVNVSAGSTNAFILLTSSFPFTIDGIDSQNAPLGTYYTAASSFPTNSATSGVIALGGTTSCYLLDNSTNTYLRGADVDGYLGFTITYQST